MNNRGFIDKMAGELMMDADDVQTLTTDFISCLTGNLMQGNVVNVQGFGIFEAKTKAERRMYNPSTKSFNVIPAKTTLGFKMSATLKDKIN